MRTILVGMSLIAGLLIASCETPFEPLPEGAVPYAPNPQNVAAWWNEVEQCSGMRGDLSRVSFYIVPEVSTFTWEGRDVIGLWMEKGNRIVLAGEFAFRDLNVRHEMLHAITRLGGHPPRYFRDLCGAIVDQPSSYAAP